MSKVPSFNRLAILAVAFPAALLGCSREVQFSENGSGLPDRCYTEVANSTFDLQGLPHDINQEVVSYLNLEWGATKGHQELLVSDLSFVGKGVRCGNEIRVWSYPCARAGTCYATVQPWKDSYVKASTSKPAINIERR